MRRVIFLMGLASMFSISSDAAAVELVKDGSPAAEIIVAPEACNSVKNAAFELRKYLEKISGAKLEIVNRPGNKHPVYIGRSEHTEKLGIKTDDIKYDGFKIVSTDAYLAIVGVDNDRAPIPRGNTSLSNFARCEDEWRKATGTKTKFPRIRDPRPIINGDGGAFHNHDATGTLYGVYAFLERLGARFFMPVEGLGQVLPKMKSISVSNLNIKEEPDFAARVFSLCVGCNGTLDKYWFKQLRLGGVYGLWPGHTSMDVMDNERDEFLVYRNGVSPDVNLPRLSSPELRSELANYLLNCRKFYPELHDLPIGQPDGWQVLDDRDVKAGWDKTSEGNWGRFSDYTWDFVLDVAGRVRAKAPGVKFNTLSYGFAKKTPKNIERIPGDINIFFTQTSCNWHKTPAEPELRKEWEAKAPDSEFFMYDYYLTHTNRNAPPLPVIFIANMDRNFKSMSSNYKGVFTEISHDSHYQTSKYRSLMKYPVLNALPYYIHSKLTWNKKADVSAMLEDFYDKFFGPAKAEMKEFYEFAEKMWMNPPASNKDKRAMVEKYFEILARAKAKAGGGDYGGRVDLIAEEMAPAKNAFSDKREGAEITVREINSNPPLIDGDLSKDFWLKIYPAEYYAAKDNFTAQSPEINQTYVRLRWVRDSLLIGITCMEKRMDSVNASVPCAKSNSEDIYFDDNIEVYLETPDGYRVKLVANPNGAVLTKLFSSPDVTDVNWLFESVAVKKHDDRWTVEINTGKLGNPVNPPTKSIPWGINVCRQRLAGGVKEYYAICPTGSRFDDFAKHGNLSLR